MTSVDDLRDAVIDAARKWMNDEPDYNEAERNLVAAVTALDEAEKPDPWALLREYVSDAIDVDGHTWDDFCKSWEPRVKAALAWKEQNDG